MSWLPPFSRAGRWASVEQIGLLGEDLGVHRLQLEPAGQRVPDLVVHRGRGLVVDEFGLARADAWRPDQLRRNGIGFQTPQRPQCRLRLAITACPKCQPPLLN
jgi:hypothetical protein